ncbi:hypothetical protein ABZ707_05075 [Streptomyces sp. NPDC006923]
MVNSEIAGKVVLVLGGAGGIVFAVEQPADVAVNEIVVRPTVQDM